MEAKDLAQHFGSSVRRELENPILRRKIEVRRESFEASYQKRVRAILARMP